MDEQEYMTERVDNQIAWYSGKSRWNQKRYKVTRLVELVAAALIPLVAVVGVTWEWRVATAGLGVVVTVAAGLLSTNRYHESWIEYRTTAEQLKHEKFAFLTKAEPYDEDSSLPRLVDRVESLVSREHTSWGRRMRPTAPAKAEEGAPAQA